jgi:adenylate kinase
LLVPDEVTIQIIEDRLEHEDCKKGFILDGFPRTIPQAKYLDEYFKKVNIEEYVVLNIEVSDDIIIKRLSGRRVCPSCGMSFHLENNPPKNEGICDKCKARLIHRDDDKQEIILKRLTTYYQQTQPLIEYYSGAGKVATIVGQKLVEDTSALVKIELAK